MRKLLLLAGALLAALTVVPAANAAYVTGISDQLSSTFANPFYSGLKLKTARYIAPYDVMDDPAQKARFDAWIAGARAQKQRVLVSFEHSRLKGKEQIAPSQSVYRRALTAFKKAYPDVKEISSWNEANHCQVGTRTEGQPRKLCRGVSGAKLAAQYYMTARKVFPRAKIVGLDVLDANNVKPSLTYIKNFKRFAKPTPKYWGVHNYSDTNRFSQKRTKAMIKAIGRTGEIWLTETGGIVSFGSNFPYNEARAARALGCMFDIARDNKRVKRLYVYNFNGAPAGFSFDAGLVSADGGSKRPGYAIVQKRKARNC